MFVHESIVLPNCIVLAVAFALTLVGLANSQTHISHFIHTLNEVKKLFLNSHYVSERVKGMRWKKENTIHDMLSTSSI